MDKAFFTVAQAMNPSDACNEEMLDHPHRRVRIHHLLEASEVGS